MLLITTSDPRSANNRSKKDDSFPLEAEQQDSKKEIAVEESSTLNTAWINLRHFFQPYGLFYLLFII